MLNKRIYKKTIAISDRDLNYIKSLRQAGNLKRNSLAGINSAIIREYKLSAKLRIVNDRNKINALKDNNVKSFTANAYLQIEKSEKCKHENCSRVFFTNGEVRTVCNNCYETLNVEVEEDRVENPLNNQPQANRCLVFSLMASS